MIEWKPDENRNCKKCENYSTGKNESFPNETIHQCKVLTEDYIESNDFTLTSIINFIIFNLDFDDDFENRELCTLANICPLYKESDSK